MKIDVANMSIFKLSLWETCECFTRSNKEEDKKKYCKRKLKITNKIPLEINKKIVFTFKNFELVLV